MPRSSTHSPAISIFFKRSLSLSLSLSLSHTHTHTHLLIPKCSTPSPIISFCCRRSLFLPPSLSRASSLVLCLSRELSRLLSCSPHSLTQSLTHSVSRPSVRALSHMCLCFLCMMVTTIGRCVEEISCLPQSIIHIFCTYSV
jgi:hypothetical protein